MKKKELKKIKLVDKTGFVIALQNYIISKKISNAGLISLALHRVCFKFAKALEELYLSEELQDKS